MTTEIKNATIYTTDDFSEQVVDTPQESFALLEKWEHILGPVEKIYSDDSRIIWQQETTIDMCENGEETEEAAVIIWDIKKAKLTVYDSWYEFLNKIGTEEIFNVLDSPKKPEQIWGEYWLKIKQKELLRLALIKIGK